MAKIYQKQGKYADALNAVDETLKVVPDSDKGHFLRGQLLQKLGRKEEASAEFSKAKHLMDADLNKDREKWNDAPVPNGGQPGTVGPDALVEGRKAAASRRTL